ncbi:Haloacid dehalogenase domain protein hydrolase [Thiorhodococcus drewsii AZ1]|uniref:Haloacid dehalogenase domain protein hydrolase n=1 Tax=Thiorhodococcus drewsii AZ1 TaxID=765913 RepID=G2DWM2_9GAMM|nr:Haloacid dehalogenase domain protein hydrolase [Thiorhodococcus drewsii AZ1]
MCRFGRVGSVSTRPLFQSLALPQICFDFDGTLVYSFDAAFNALQSVGPAFGCGDLTREQLQDMRGMHVRDVIRILGVPLYRVPQLARRMRAAMRAELMETPPVEGVPELLLELDRRGYRLGLLSSNAESSLRDYVARYGLNQFDVVIGGTGLFSKARALRGLIRREGIRAADLIYVGDELRDLDAARDVGAGFAAVSWGYTAPEGLASAGPDCLLERPGDLLEHLVRIWPSPHD